MIKRVASILLKTFLLIIGITFLSFLLSYAAPSDPAAIALKKSGMMVTEEALAQKREELGLNEPFLKQYGHWLINMLKGDFGTSYKTGKPVVYELSKTLPATLLLTICSMLLTIVISLPLGILCAKYKNGFIDYLVRGITYIFASIPSFFLALLLMYILSLKFKLLPVIGSVSFKGIVMPMLVLSLTLAAWYIRQIRSMILEEMGKDYVEGAKSRGISENRILFVHILKNSFFPMLTLFGMSFGVMLGGSAIVESIFSWPGIGRLAVTSITARDYPVIQAYVVWMALIYLLINTLVDMISELLDPRVRRGMKGI